MLLAVEAGVLEVGEDFRVGVVLLLQFGDGLIDVLDKLLIALEVANLKVGCGEDHEFFGVGHLAHLNLSVLQAHEEALYVLRVEA